MRSLIDRHAALIAQRRLSRSPSLIIEGARQVGKSTLARQVADDGAVHVTLDDEQVRDAAAADPEGFIGQAGDGQLVIDELQRLPSLTLALKAAIDRDRRPGRFIVTGSASLLTVRGTADSLAGRAARLRLHGFSQGELHEQPDDLAHTVRTAGLDSLVRSAGTHTRSGYAAIVVGGSYLDAIPLSARDRGEWIDDYLRSIITRDLPELRRVVQPARAMSLLRTLSGRQSAELVQARLATDVEIPRSTLPAYLDLLRDVGLIDMVPPWTPNLARREVGRQKSFVLDSAIATRLARVTLEQLSSVPYGEALGSFLEAWVVAELRKQQTWSQEEFELFHYRDRNGHEVDLVLEFADGAVLGVEVKASSSYSAQQFRGLVKMRDQLGDRFIGGIVLGTAERGYRYADRLVGAPISALWESAARE